MTLPCSSSTVSSTASTLMPPTDRPLTSTVSRADCARLIFVLTADPATGEIIGTCPEMTVDDTKKAIQSAYNAFQTFKLSTPAQRNTMLLKLQRLFEDNAKDLARLIVWENGKSWNDAYTEAVYAGSYVAWYAPEALRTNGQTIPCSMPGTRNFTIKQPVGVCALLVPYVA